MTNFEKIKNMSRAELAEFLDEIGFDETPWVKWFDREFCSKCDIVLAPVGEGDNTREAEFSYCELEHKCRFFDQYCDVWENPKRMIEFWLNDDAD